MTSSTFNRSILLTLLPVIVLVLYVEGQKYDPALIRFTSSDVSVGSEAALFPREVDGLNRSGQVRIYSKDNLYEYVNGHAEYFISAGFVRLAVAEYIRTGTEPTQPDVVVDIYDMGKAIQAYGVYSSESGDQGAAIQVGSAGIKTDQGITFIRGKYYIRITSFQGAIPLEPMAREIDTLLGATPEEMTSFSRLPELEEVVTTRYIKEAYRGLDFANNVTEREYRIQGDTVQVSLMTGTDSEIDKLVGSFLAFFKESDTPYELIRKNGRELYKIMDPYEGEWYLVPFPGSLFGIYGVTHENVLDTLLTSIAASREQT